MGMCARSLQKASIRGIFFASRPANTVRWLGTVERFFSVLLSCRFRVLLGLGLAMGCLPAVSLADCRADYNVAVGILQEALAGLEQRQAAGHQDFEARYGDVVERMVANRCERELMDLFQFAQDEKQKRDSSSGNSSTP